MLLFLTDKWNSKKNKNICDWDWKLFSKPTELQFVVPHQTEEETKLLGHFMDDTILQKVFLLFFWINITKKKIKCIPLRYITL